MIKRRKYPPCMEGLEYTDTCGLAEDIQSHYLNGGEVKSVSLELSKWKDTWVKEQVKTYGVYYPYTAFVIDKINWYKIKKYSIKRRYRMLKTKIKEPYWRFKYKLKYKTKKNDDDDKK